MDKRHGGDLPSHQTLPDILPYDPSPNPYRPVTFHQLRAHSADPAGFPTPDNPAQPAQCGLKPKVRRISSARWSGEACRLRVMPGSSGASGSSTAYWDASSWGGMK